jgi:hypothetical protein
VFLSKLRLRKMADGGQMVSSYSAIQQTSLIASRDRENCRPAKCQVAAAGESPSTTILPRLAIAVIARHSVVFPSH